jgi:hypothetical protein
MFTKTLVGEIRAYSCNGRADNLPGVFYHFVKITVDSKYCPGNNY